MEGQWDVAITSLQDLYSANKQLPFDSIKDESKLNSQSQEELEEYKEQVIKHKEQIETNQRILDTLIQSTNSVFTKLSQSNKGPQNGAKKKGKSFHQSLFNSSEPVVAGSEVAFKLRQRGQESEWIQCEVTRVVSDVK